MGDKSPIDVFSAPLSLGRGRRLKVEREKTSFSLKKQICIFLRFSDFFEVLKNPFRLTEVGYKKKINKNNFLHEFKFDF